MLYLLLLLILVIIWYNVIGKKLNISPLTSEEENDIPQDFDGVNFTKTNFSGTKFEDLSIKAANFNEANLTNAVFINVDKRWFYF